MLQQQLLNACVLCRHLHQLLEMKIDMPHMVNMRMETRAATTAAAQGTEDVFVEQLGDDTELAEHSQMLGKGLL